MTKRANIAASIEKNRIALLRLVFCWLSVAFCFNPRDDRILPKRFSRFAEELISTAEKATGYLLIAVFYHGQNKRQTSPDYKKAAMRLITANRMITVGALTIHGVIKRLRALQQILHQIHLVSRRLGKSIAALRRLAAWKAEISASNAFPHEAITMRAVDPAHPP